MGLEISLDTPKEVVLQPEQKATITKFTINRMVDLPKERIVRIFVDEFNEPIVLFEGDAYDEIGQWTEGDVENRLKEIYK